MPPEPEVAQLSPKLSTQIWRGDLTFPRKFIFMNFRVFETLCQRDMNQW